VEAAVGHFPRTVPHDGLIIVHVPEREMVQHLPAIQQQQAQAEQ
jgi:hypothetical protein